MKRQQDILKQGGSVFFGTLITAIVFNYFGSLLIYNRIHLNLSVDILFSLIVAIVSCFRSLWKRLENLEQRIKAMEFQLNKKK